MKNKNLLKQIEMFDTIIENGISPNQYYLLCCIRDSIKPNKINIHLELRNLQGGEWLDGNNKLTPKSITLIDSLEKLFNIKKKNTSTELMTKDYKEYIEAYNKTFPNRKLPSGKAARSATGNLEKAFRWFFENHKYEWPLIIEATMRYINDQEANNWKFCRTSQYFIRKDNLSDLADLCEAIKTGGYEDREKNTHTIKVV
jgi:hypothetical protein